MKKFLKLSVFMSLLLLMTRSYSQSYNGTKTTPIYVEGYSFVNYLDSVGFEIVHVEYDLVFSYKIVDRFLTKGWTYNIFAFADKGVSELSVSIYIFDFYANDWVLVEENSIGDRMASITFAPSSTERYKIMINVVSFNSGYDVGRYGLILYHE